MRVLAFMQNMWLKNPERWKDTLQRYIDRGKHEHAEQLRKRMIHYALFAGCRSGQVLKRYLGEKHCSNIIWDESSLQIGGVASSSFPANIEHMQTRIISEDPDLILGFGKTACEALTKINPRQTWMVAPHPTSRYRPKYDAYSLIKSKLDKLCTNG